MFVKYRMATKNDLEELAKIAKKKERQFGDKDIEIPLFNFPECCFVMEVDGKPAGAVLFSKIRKDTVYSDLWFVDPKYNHQGFGKELEKISSSYLVEQGIKRIIASVDAERKKTIKKCTEELGWKLIGKVDKEVWIYKDLKK